MVGGGWFKHPILNSENTAGKDPYPLPPTSYGEVKTVNLPNFALYRCSMWGILEHLLSWRG